MTLHAVIGEGSINTRELTHQLEDLWAKAIAESANFWFIVQGKEAPTQADQDMVAFFKGNSVYFVTIADENVMLDDLYADAEENHTYDGDFADALVEALTALQEDDEGADLLALLIDPKTDNPGDEAAIIAIEAVINAKFQAFCLNDSMEEIKLEEPPPPAETPKTAKKAASKAADVAPKDATITPLAAYTRSELEGLTPGEIKALATGMGITGRGKKDYVENILKSQAASEDGAGNGSTASVTPITGGQLGQVTTTTGSPATFTYSGTTNVSGLNAPWLASERALVVIHHPAGIQIRHIPLDKLSVLESL